MGAMCLISLSNFLPVGILYYETPAPAESPPLVVLVADLYLPPHRVSSERSGAREGGRGQAPRFQFSGQDVAKPNLKRLRGGGIGL